MTKLETARHLCLPCRVPNLYLLMKADGPSDEISADFYQREDDAEHKQLTFRLTIASYERTLTDDEVAMIEHLG